MNDSTQKILDLSFRCVNSGELENVKAFEEGMNHLNITDASFDFHEADWALIEREAENYLKERALDADNPFEKFALLRIIRPQH